MSTTSDESSSSLALALSSFKLSLSLVMNERECQFLTGREAAECLAVQRAEREGEKTNAIVFFFFFFY